MPRKLREKQRITIPDVCRNMEEQMNGEIKMNDFYPVPFISSISNFFEAMKGSKQYRFSTHYACGVGTYVFKEGKNLIPITRFVDVEGLFKYLDDSANEIKNSKFKGVKKTVSALKILWNIKKFIDTEKTPEGLNLMKLLTDAFMYGDYNVLGKFHDIALFIGMMHFMDLYNYDIDRVQRCCIHYAVPDGRIIPFCAFNVIPQVFRDKTQKEFSISPKEWEKKHKKKLKDDKFVRKLTEEKKRKVKKFYAKFKRK